MADHTCSSVNTIRQGLAGWLPGRSPYKKPQAGRGRAPSQQSLGTGSELWLSDWPLAACGPAKTININQMAAFRPSVEGAQDLMLAPLVALSLLERMQEQDLAAYVLVVWWEVCRSRPVVYALVSTGFDLCEIGDARHLGVYSDAMQSTGNLMDGFGRAGQGRAGLPAERHRTESGIPQSSSKPRVMTVTQHAVSKHTEG